MLRDEPHRTYYVYPSWADLSYRWEDLPRLLADPLHSGYFEDRATRIEYWTRLDYPAVIKPATFLNGPAGGGVIQVDSVYPEKWLPANILNKEANLRTPDSLISYMYHSERKPCAVHYLEPFSSPEWTLITGKKHKILGSCTTTVEHVESDSEHAYWLIVYKKAKHQLKNLGEVPQWAEHFGLNVSRLEAVPQQIAEETSDWVVDPQWESTWFSVEGGKDRLGYQLSIGLYIGLHLMSLERRLSSIHVVSGLETPVNIRRHGPRR